MLNNLRRLFTAAPDQADASVLRQGVSYDTVAMACAQRIRRAHQCCRRFRRGRSPIGVDRAGTVTFAGSVKSQLKQWEDMGYGKLPVCIAKTQYSFSTDPNQRGAPSAMA